MWSKIKNIYPVWYFDATGSILNKIANQGEPFLFSFVCHDRLNKQIVPVAQFISTAHAAFVIGKFLTSIKHIYEAHMPCQKNEFIMPPIIVTDFSYALINAVMENFNKCYLINYINWCFQYFVQYKNNKEIQAKLAPLMKTKIYLCAAHFLKSLVKKVRKIDLDKNRSITFIFCFGLLQNSTTLEQFESYLHDIFNLFTNEHFDSSVIESLKKLRLEISNRDIKSLNVDKILKESDKINTKELNGFYIDPIGTNKIKENSPFTYYFNNIIQNFEKIKNISKKGNILKKTIPNHFFNPSLFKFIKDKLHLMPLWTGLIIHHLGVYLKIEYLINLTRLVNNPVENDFGDFKCNTLQRKKVATSELAKASYDRINHKKGKELKLKRKRMRKKTLKGNLDKGFYYKSMKNFGFK